MMNEKFTWNPEDYEKNSAAQYSWAKQIITGLDLKGNERILDIGCGDGKNTIEIAGSVRKGSVLGIDSSLEMISLAQKRQSLSCSNNLEFAYGDASNLKFDGEFDLVVSFACLHWVKDHVPVLVGIKNSLKPGGRTFLQFGGQGNASALFNAAHKIISGQEWQNYFSGFSFPYAFYAPLEYVKYLENTGLRTRRVELIPKEIIHTSKESLIGWMRTTWLPYLERVPEHRREEFLLDIIEEYLHNHPADDQGCIHVHMMRLEVEADREQS